MDNLPDMPELIARREKSIAELQAAWPDFAMEAEPPAGEPAVTLSIEAYGRLCALNTVLARTAMLGRHRPDQALDADGMTAVFGGFAMELRDVLAAVRSMEPSDRVGERLSDEERALLANVAKLGRDDRTALYTLADSLASRGEPPTLN